LEDHEKARAAQLEEFQSGLDRRLASLDRGKGVEGKEVFSQIRRKSKERRQKRA